MFTRFLSLFLVVATLAACSSTDDQSDASEQVMVSEREDISGGPLDAGVDGFDRSFTDGPVAGTQQDLVVNVGDRVFFGYDRFDLSQEARTILERQAQWLNQHQNLNVTVEGHADERGTREYNLALGDRRANSIKRYLVALGVDPRRVSTISFGKEQPAVFGSNPEAWAQNRRGVLRVD